LIGGFSFARCTQSHKEIPRLIGSFKGLYGPLAIEAAMSALSHCPEAEWAPVISHLDALEKKRLIRRDESTGVPCFYLTKEGERVANGWLYRQS
jgi:hypothetical protein